MTQPTWSISKESIATLQGKAAARLDLAVPATGLSNVSCGGLTANRNRLLGLQVSDRNLECDPPSDFFARGADLVVSYPARSTDRVRHQLHFSVNANTDCCSFEAVLSAQTSLLESEPRMRMVSQFRDARLFEVTEDGTEIEITATKTYTQSTGRPSYLLVRPNGEQTTIVCGVHPSDFFESQVEYDPAETTISFDVFPESLEKGVIQKARFQACLVSRNRDGLLASIAFDEFIRTAPPLTA